MKITNFEEANQFVVETIRMDGSYDFENDLHII